MNYEPAVWLKAEGEDAVRNRHTAFPKFFGESSRPDFTGGELSSVDTTAFSLSALRPMIGLSGPITLEELHKDT